MGSASAVAPKASKKIVARATFVNISKASASVLRDCFRQFEIQSVDLEENPAQRLHREKFEALVVHLDDNAPEVLEATRTSPSNKRIVIFGISDGTPKGLRFSKYGINTMLEEPLDRQKVLKAVRSAHLLIIHELRRYVRIPLVMEVRVEGDGGRNFDATSIEISGGGMSLSSRAPVPKISNVQVAFTLPNTPKTVVSAAVCWRREAENMIGVRFDINDDRRFVVRKWIDDFLEND